MNRVGEGGPGRHDALATRGERAVNYAVLADYSGEIHLGDDFDDPGAADAGDAAARDGLGKGRIIGPEVRADDLEARLERDGIDAHALDGAGSRALAAADLRSLEGGTRRARAGEQTLGVSEDDLGVGADVDQQRELR